MNPPDRWFACKLRKRFLRIPFIHRHWRIIRRSVPPPLVRAKNAGAEEIHIRWVLRHRIDFQPVWSPFWQWGLFCSCHHVYRFSRRGPLSQGFFGVLTIIHIFKRSARALINVLVASTASSLRLASFSTPQLRHRSVNADATAEWDSQVFSSERFG